MKGRVIKVVGFSVALIAVLHAHAFGQRKQLVVLKKQKVIHRIHYGDDIIFKKKGSDQKIVSYVNNLFDTAVQAHNMIVPLHTIDRLYFKRGSYMNVIGGLAFAGGIGYFLIDQINVVLVHGDKPNVDDRVAVTSVAMVAVGLPMMLIKKKSQRIRHKYRLLTVEEGSPFYQRELDRVDF